MGVRGYMLAVLVVAHASVYAETSHLVLEAEDSTDTRLTVYNGNYAVVRDTRMVVLPVGTYEVEYRGIARDIDPSSVIVDSSKAGISIIEQNYRFDLVNKSSLLQRFIGRKLKYSRSMLQGTTYEKVLREGTLLSIDPAVVQFGDEIEIEPEGVISLPYFPEDLASEPTLVWLLENKLAGNQSLSITYLTNNISWHADHVAVLSRDQASMDVTSWVTLSNRSGVTFGEAGLQLVAGEVNRVSAPPPGSARGKLAFGLAEAAPTRESLLDYHLYTVPGRTTLTNNQLKQLKLLKADGINVLRRYVLTSEAMRHPMPEPQTLRFDVVLDFVNDALQPLPAGRMRVYSSDQAGIPQLVGEDRVGHIAVDAEVTVKLGKAFDLSARRTQTDLDRVGDRVVDVSYRVDVSNHKPEAVSVRLEERVTGDWRVLKESHKGVKSDSTKLTYDLDLEAGAEEAVAYTVRVRW